VRFSIAINMMRRRPDVPMETVAAQTLEMVVAAERLGFDVAWAAEHHTIEYSARQSSRRRTGTRCAPPARSPWPTS
jgi:alkanesulfonate monooxygenase SsuD/methylene tetrahydromethanopterin reductase-like flavin-dependent oxidoreductase (luciferase family)